MQTYGVEMNSHSLYIKTFGCQMNVYDAGVVANIFRSRGFRLSQTWDKADVVFINTCCVREKAEQKACSFIGCFRRIKQWNPSLIIAVGGCMAQRMGHALFERFPFVDIVLGADAFYRFSELVDSFKKTGRKQIDVSFSRDFPNVVPLVRYSPSSITAMVTIMQGCDNFCTYCIVPYVKGREKSRSSKDIINEINVLTSKGVKEVTLLGQNVNSYGHRKGDLSFPQLIKKIAKETDLLRLRFTTSHPKDLSVELMECFGDVGILCNHIHLPVQAGSNRILRRMKRGYTREEYLAKVAQLRQCCPGIALSTDVMVGFPGETEEDYLDTLSLLEEVRFDIAFSFRYSDRPGTAAAKFRDKVPEEVKARRLVKLQEMQGSITLEQNEKLVGTVQKVLVEGPSEGNFLQLTGRTRDNHIVNFCGPRNLIGKMVPVSIVRAYPHSLKGEFFSLGEEKAGVKAACMAI